MYRNGLRIKRNSASLVLLSGFILACILFLACAETNETIKVPTSTWNGRYYYDYQPPESKPPASVKLNLAIVNASFAEKAKMEPQYKEVSRALANSLAADFNKIIIAKGITVSGPYESLDMMTYPQKQNANLTLMPVITFNSRTAMGQWFRAEGGGFARNGTVYLDGWILLEILEPMSGQKMWIKKIDVGQVSRSAAIIAERKKTYDKNGNFYGYAPGAVLFDGREDAMATLIKGIYPVVMQKCWDYINSEELLMLNAKANEIRSLKRY